MTTKPTFWPGTQTLKSTGNAFDLAPAKPSGFATMQEAMKAKKTGISTCDSFKTIEGLSQKAQKALKVPAKRVSISISKPRDKKRMSKKAAI